MTILEFLASRGGYYSTAEIKDATGVSDTEARKRLRGLLETGRIESRRYTCPGDEKPTRQYRAVKA